LLVLKEEDEEEEEERRRRRRLNITFGELKSIRHVQSLMYKKVNQFN
jgi:hypothetical protein